MICNTFPNYGFVQDDVPTSIMKELETMVTEVQTDECRITSKKLAGNIELTYQLQNSKTLENYLLTLCDYYSSNHDLTHTTKNLSSRFLSLDNCWVNVQKKNEFQPMHSHDGDFSFVIWTQIPYNLSEEHCSKSTAKSNSPRQGMFSFFYTNIFGEIREAAFPVDQNYQGKIFLFPGCLNHMVYGFQSSEQSRISISGNLTRRLCTIL
jgi:hypothetical protein